MHCYPVTSLTTHSSWGSAQELDVNMFSVLVYSLHSKGEDGHSAAAHIVSG